MSITRPGGGGGLIAQSGFGVQVAVVTGVTTSGVRAANTAALNAAAAAAVAAGHGRVILPAGVIHYGTDGQSSGIHLTHGHTEVEFWGNTLGPLNDGAIGTTLSYWGTGAAIELDSDDSGAWDASTYDGVEGVGFQNLALVYGGTSTTALANGKGNYGTGTYGVRDWRGGRINGRRFYVANFEYGLWGIQSDENSIYEGKVKRCRIGHFLGPRSDQALVQSLEYIYNDTAVDIDGVSQARFHACQFVNNGSPTTPPIRVHASLARQAIGNLFSACWFEHLVAVVDTAAVFELGVGDTNPVLDTQIINPYVVTHASGGGARAATFVRIGNATRTLISDPAMQFSNMFDQLVEFVGATPSSPDLTVRCHEQHQYNTLTSGANTPVVHYDLRTSAGGKGIGGPLAFFSLTSRLRRWAFNLANTESTGNAGSDLTLTAYNDDGSIFATIMTFARASGSLLFGNGINFQFGTTSGTKLGTSTTQKIGFFGKSPIVQPGRVGALTDSSGGSVSTTISLPPGTYSQTDEAIFRASVTAKLNAIDTKLSAAAGGLGLTA